MARTLVAGASGNGKSWEMGRYLERVVPRFKYGIHYDLENEEPGLCVSTDDSPAVYKAWYVDEAGLDEWDLPETIRQEQKLRIVPDGLTDEEVVKLFALVCRTAMHISNQEDMDFHISADEAHNFVPKAGLHDDISRALTGGRKRGLEWCLSTQRGQNLHEDAIGQANWGIYFGMSGRDAEKFDNYTTFNATRELPKLTKRECIYENRDRGDSWKVNTDEKTRTHPHMADDDGIADEFLASQNPDGSIESEGEA